VGDNISTAQELLGDLAKVPLHSYAEWGLAPDVLPVRVQIFPEQEQFRYFYVVSVRIFTKVPYLRQLYYTEGLDQDRFCLESV